MYQQQNNYFATNSCHFWFSCLLLIYMSILSYFKIKPKVNHLAEPCAELPDPNGPLSTAIPSSTIAAVNKKLSSPRRSLPVQIKAVRTLLASDRQA